MHTVRIIPYIVTIFLLTITAPLNVNATEKFTVYTVNYPLAYFTERIGGEHVNVEFSAPPYVDPAFWKPDDETVRLFQKADLIILNGAGYAKWTRTVSLPMLRQVDTSKAFNANLIHIETNVTHSHGPKGDHSHGGTAFTTWLDFSQAALQAEAIYKALFRKMPTRKDYFAKNFEELKGELLELDKQMKEIGKRLAGAPLLASHPIYQYLARRYNLNIRMVMWEPGEDPGQHEWLHLQEVAKEHPAKWMIWEAEPLPVSVDKLKSMGISSTVFAPSMNKPDTGDFMDVMHKNVLNLRNAFQ